MNTLVFLIRRHLPMFLIGLVFFLFSLYQFIAVDSMPTHATFDAGAVLFGRPVFFFGIFFGLALMLKAWRKAHWRKA
jgi:uncharacterized membrane protein